jgi:hypothetical protein
VIFQVQVHLEQAVVQAEELHLIQEMQPEETVAAEVLQQVQVQLIQVAAVLPVLKALQVVLAVQAL